MSAFRTIASVSVLVVMAAAAPVCGQAALKSFLLTPVGGGRYIVTDLGNLGGAQHYTWPAGMNNLGQVVGASSTTSGIRAFQWTPGEGMRDLGTLADDPTSLAYGVNDLGQVVGMSIPANNSEPPFNGLGRPLLWTQAGGIKHLGAVVGASAEDINAQGMVCGTIAASPWSLQVFVWTASSGLRYIDLFGGELNMVRAINNAGAVVGAGELPDGMGTHAYLWTEESGPVDLGTLPGDRVSVAQDINDLAQIVGWTRGFPPTGSVDRAFLWSKDKGMQELEGFGTEANAYGINDAGVVVGACMTDGAWSAAVWENGLAENGVAKDLNTLVPAGFPWKLSYAKSVNAQGQILAAWDPYLQVPTTIVIGECDTGVPNTLLPDGFTMADAVAQAAGTAENQGQFASTASRLANDWRRLGLISGAEKGRIQQCIATAVMTDSGS